MVNLMRRRREMMEQAAESWDYEWDYSNGKLEEQTGWKVSINRTASSEMISDGEKLLAPTNNSYIQIYMPSENSNRLFTSGYGTLEVTCYGKWWDNNDAVNLRITAAVSGTKRITLFIFNGQWRIYDNATKANCTVLRNAVNNTRYTIKIVMRDTVADVYINDVLAVSDFGTDATLYGGINQVMGQNFGGPHNYAVIQSLKLKHRV